MNFMMKPMQPITKTYGNCSDDFHDDDDDNDYHDDNADDDDDVDE